MPVRNPLTLALILLTCWACAPASAEAEQQTVSVMAVGEIKVRPDTVQISGLLSESNEKMKDAVTAFNDTRRRALASIKAAGIENLTITTSALSLSVSGDIEEYDRFGNEIAKPMPKGSLTISQSVTLKITGLDKLEEQAVIDLVVKLIGAARESGVDINAMSQADMYNYEWGNGTDTTGTAIFSISDPDKLRKDATKKAMAKARADAEFLAELAGGKLGPVVAITDGSGGESYNPYYYYGMMEDLDEFSTPSLDEISVQRSLAVSFRLITE